MSERGRELRLALGMRGGVSLAVWIGGACTEIDELRRARDDGEEGFWTDLTRTTDHRSVVVDVMAGASAGGLNGVLFAACQAYGVRFRSLRRTWLDVGSTRQLVRTDATEADRSTPAHLRWLSLFRGDGHMYRQIVDQLTDLIDGVAVRPNRPPRLDLRLSATHVEPLLRAVRSPVDEPLFARRFGSEFRFVAPDEVWLDSDFPPYAAPGEPGRTAFVGHISRLALAARTTSSFPGAFEAAFVRSSRPPSFATADPPPDGDLRVDMAGIFADRRDDDPFVLADGGIIDNIPLTRAFDAIGSAPASGPTERHLVYLHPGAPSVPTPSDANPPTEQRRRSIVSVLRGAAGSKMGSEDISGDIARIDDHNRDVARAVAVRRATFESLTDRAALLAMARAARDSYLAQRAAEDSLLIADLLDDPLRFLGDDPFPSAVGGRDVADDRWRSPLGRFGIGERHDFAAGLDTAFTTRLRDWTPQEPPGVSIFATGARPLVRTARTLLEWARYVERHAAQDAGPASEAKAALYRVLAFVEASVERPRRLAWVALAATADDVGADGTVEAMLARLQRLTAFSLDRIEQVGSALLATDEGERDTDRRQEDDTLRAVVDEVRSRIDVVVSGPAPADDTGAHGADGPDDADIRREIATRVLVPLAEQLRGVPVADPAAVSPPDPSSLLHRVLGGTDPIDASTLAAVEVACYGEYATGEPGRRRVDFVRLSAANPTPLAPWFTALEDDAADTDGGPRYWDGSNTDWPRQEGIHVELKLAGNELSNFSAFLRKEWRQNDWMWGRLDAVPTLIALLVTPHALRARQLPTSDVTDELKALLTAPGPRGVQELGEALWHEQSVTIASEIDAVLGAETDEAAAGAPLTVTRRVLVARRQWEILADELDGDQRIDERVASYRVGAETIHDDAIRSEIRSRLKEIVRSASNTVVANAWANGITRWGTPSDLSWRGRGTRRAVRIAGWLGTRKLLGK